MAPGDIAVRECLLGYLGLASRFHVASNDSLEVGEGDVLVWPNWVWVA